MNSLASVIIPTYNRSKMLVRALESVQGQSYRPIEILVIDDGSTDNTTEAVNEWSQEDSADSLTVRYFRKENNGPSSYRNIGLRHAKGDYIYFLDSDDYMHDSLLQNAISLLESEDSDCVIFGFERVSSSGSKERFIPRSQAPLKSFLEGSLGGSYTSTSLKRRDLVYRLGPWDESLHIAEDYEYLGRALLNAKATSAL